MSGMNLPTLLTVLRVIAIPFIVIVYYLPISEAHLLAAILFVLAALTDALDGYLARTMALTTRFGAFLDPVADKLLVSVALILVVGNHVAPYLVVPAMIIMGREIVISSLREWMAELGKRASIAVSWIGKVKTALQMSALTVLLWLSAGSPFWVKITGVLLLYVAALLTIWSMCIYLKLAWPELNAGRKN